MGLRHLLYLQVIAALLAWNMKWQQRPTGLFLVAGKWQVGVYEDEQYCVAGVYKEAHPRYLVQLTPEFAFYRGRK